MLRKHFACVIYAALLAAWINALAPGVSYLFASAAGKEVVEVCTSFGLKKVQLDVPADPLSAKHDPRCQFCLASLDAATISHPPAVPPHRLVHDSPARALLRPPPAAQGHERANRPRAPPSLPA